LIVSRLLRAGIGAALMVSSPAMAADGFGRIESVPVAFNGTAKAFNAPMRMVVTSCEPAETKSCTFGLSGEMAAIATLQKGTRNADTVTILYGANSDAQQFLVAIGVAMATWSPAADVEERGLALTTLTNAVKEKATREVTLEGVRYTMTTKTDAGFVFLKMSRP
jgi:hypothetical protein